MVIWSEMKWCNISVPRKLFSDVMQVIISGINLWKRWLEHVSNLCYIVEWKNRMKLHRLITKGEIWKKKISNREFVFLHSKWWVDAYVYAIKNIYIYIYIYISNYLFDFIFFNLLVIVKYLIINIDDKNV